MYIYVCSVIKNNIILLLMDTLCSFCVSLMRISDNFFICNTLDNHQWPLSEVSRGLFSYALFTSYSIESSFLFNVAYTQCWSINKCFMLRYTMSVCIHIKNILEVTHIILIAPYIGTSVFFLHFLTTDSV